MIEQNNLNEVSTKTSLLEKNKTSKSSKMKFIFGVVALLFVDIIWVASSQLTRYLFKDVQFDKPYMSTYIKISLFTVYLFGFVLYSPWRRQCIRCACDDYPGQYQLVGETDTEDTDEGDYTVKNSMSESVYVPAKIPSASDIDSYSDGEKQIKVRVKFNSLMEVKHLEDCQDSKIARMNYGAALRAKSLIKSLNGKLPLTRVIYISILFTFVFFLGNLSYQEAIAVEKVAVVNIFSATSGIFTLILAALFPSSVADQFSITKLFAVLLSFGGIVAVSIASSTDDSSSIFSSDSLTTGALWAVLGSFCYAVYLVAFKKSVGREENIDIPMFFGFVGLFCMVLLWPGMLAFHYINFETFQLPPRLPAILLLLNGLIGTVLSELLWLWGCLATSSLMGTLSLSLTIPLSIATDILFRQAHYSWLFYIGTCLVFFSFVIVTYLSHHNPQHDPLLQCFKKCFCCFTRNKTEYERLQEIPLTLFADEES